MADNNTMEVLSLTFADAKVPEFKKVHGRAWIPNGDEEGFPDFIQMLFDKSAKHSAIIGGKVTYIIGNGLEVNGAAWDGMANESQKWNELLPILCLDIENQGGFYLEVKPRLAGGYNYYHLSYDRCRTNEENTRFWYKKDWKKAFIEYENKTTEYPAFKKGIAVDSIFYYKEPSSKKRPYAIPAWFACANWVEADAEVSRWTLTNAKTGFSASKMLNFFNGEPKEGEKRVLQQRIENVATGSEGKKILVTYNNPSTTAPEVSDLGSSDLTKEDYRAVDELITGNVYAGHKVTNPMLFGIQTPGKLGNSQELRTSYEIFKNTYANGKQQVLEGLVKKLAGYNNEPVEGLKIKDLAPVGVEFSEASILSVAPRSWVLEQLGIDTLKYTDAPAGGTAAPQPTQQGMANDILTNLTAKQHQQISRIVRQYEKGKTQTGAGTLTKEQAALMLKNGFGFTDDDVNAYLGLGEPAQFSEQFDETDVALMFMECGEERDGYTLVSSDSYTGDDEAMAFAFKTMQDLSELEKQISALIKKDKAITNKTIADSLGKPLEVIDAAVAKLLADGLIEAAADGTRKTTGGGKDSAPPQVVVRYSYEKRPDVPGPVLLPTSRPFCVKMVGLNRYFSREDIQKISERLGYSVFKRAGGFWNNDGKVEKQCRHEWRQNILIKKK